MRAKVIGYILFVFGLIIQLYLIFKLNNLELNYTSLSNIIGGVLLILSPQVFIDLVKKFVDKKSEEVQ
jgi:hypothetical protein